jgi:protein-glutamine gamma-glutamyltransferase
MSLLSVAIGIWGWQTGFWVVAIPMILVFEGRRFVKQRWSFSLNDLKSIFKLCGGAIGLLLIFLLITQRSFSLIYSLLQWLPVCVFPLIAADAYSSTSLSSLLRLLFSNPSSLKKGFSWKQNPIHLYIPYFALCLLSASATNVNGFKFYVMAATLIAMLLRNHRPQRSHPMLWVCLILLASGMGFFGHLQLHQLQAKLEQQSAPWLSGISGDSVDPYQANPRMGSIGDLKQSNAIVFRVAGDRHSFPILLREATYNKYGSASWIATQSKFAPVPPNPDGKTWKLGTVITPSPSITVSSNLNSGKGILRLPNGTSEIRQLPVDQMKKNQYGTVKVEGQQGAIAYQIQFNSDQSGDSLPTQDDLQIPDAEMSAIQQTLKVLNLQDKPNPEVLNQVSAYFEKNFRYSLKRSDSNQASTPLSTFLLKSRSGHCEYFASATTLLLRGAGIPARYAVGYSVHEFSPLEGQYIVRSRNAHAWVMAYVNGTWQSFDTTPPNWTAQEDSAASPLQAILDLWAFVGFKLASAGVWGFVGLAIAPITAFFLWKWVRKFWMRRSVVPAIVELEPMSPLIKEGLDSEFYLIEQSLDALNLKRIASESLQEWITRLNAELPESEFEILKSIISLHNRYRFDPQGIEATERETLRSLSQAWLDRSQKRVLNE